MKLTLFINPAHPAGDSLAQRFAEHAEQVRVARQAGFDGVVMGHHLSHGAAVWFPPLPTLARLAAEAEGMVSTSYSTSISRSARLAIAALVAARAPGLR